MYRYLILLCLFVSPAWAHDFSTPLTDFRGKPLVTEDGSALTLREAVTTALVAPFKDENPSGTEKVKRWQLAAKLQASKDVELTADDIALIKNLVAKAYGPMIVGQVWAILDPASLK
jgi:hypothetical protein